MKKFRLPYGVQDYLPEESYQKSCLEEMLAGVFYNAGFEKVETGALEYYDLYDGVSGSDGINHMFKLTDSDGSLLVLRPDITLQISRMAATKLSGGLNKLYYIENSYEFLSDTNVQSARTREFAQVGIEILGKSGLAGDIEAVVLAIEALRASGLNDFLIEIGHIDFVRGILKNSGLNKSETIELMRCINLKDALGTEMMLGNKKLSTEAATVIKSINSLYGDECVLFEAEKLTQNSVSRAAIQNLREIITAIKAIGYDKYVSVDLGLLKGDYYSGLVIRGLSKDFGVSILDGGRYDELGAAFGKPTESVGFAIGTKRLLTALGKQNPAIKLRMCDYAYINQEGFSVEEFKRISELRGQNIRAVKLFGIDKNQLVAHCKKNGIKKAIVFLKTGAEEITV